MADRRTFRHVGLIKFARDAVLPVLGFAVGVLLEAAFGLSPIKAFQDLISNLVSLAPGGPEAERLPIVVKSMGLLAEPMLCAWAGHTLSK